MKLEKRSGGSEDPEIREPIPASGTAPGKKPVVVYIMILFIAAFLLMALSFFMHQRSNTEALGELQHSVSAMQEIQATQDKVIALQEELADAEDRIAALAGELAESEQDIQDAQETTAALESLYCLQQSYSARDYDACREIIQAMEASGAPARLPETAAASGDITPPSLRYLQLKEAVEAQ